MATRAHVTELLHRGHSYESAGRELGLPAGQVYMIATGLPADGSSVPGAQERAAEPPPPASSQLLVNPRPSAPARNQRIVDWVRERAAHELHGRDR